MYKDSKWAIFSENILRLRENYGLTETDMAGIMHISKANLRIIESGDYPVGMGTSVFYFLAEHFNMEPRDFFEPIENKNTDESLAISVKLNTK